MSDTNELVLAAQGGDEKAFGQLVLAYQAIAEMAVRSFQGALGHDELLQEVWLRVFRVLDRYSPGTNFRAWLYRVARNTAINMIRRENLRRKSFPTRTGQGEFNEPRDILVALATEEDPGRWLQVTQVDDVMRSLDPKWVEILNLTIVGFSYREIADSLDVPLGTVMSRLFRARHAFMAQAGRMGILAEFMSEVGISPNSSTQKVGSREVGTMTEVADVESVLRLSWVQGIERMTGLPQSLWAFARAFYREHNKGQWFGVVPEGYRYLFVAREVGGHERLLEVVEILESRGYFKKSRVKRTRQPLWGFSKSLEDQFLVSAGTKGVVTVVPLAPTTVRKVKNHSPEVRVNGNSPPEEGKAPATSGKEENEVANELSSKERELLVQVYIQTGDDWFSSGMVDLTALGGVTYSAYTARISAAAKKSGFMERRGTTSRSERRFIRDKFPAWMVDAVTKAGVDTDADAKKEEAEAQARAEAEAKAQAAEEGVRAQAEAHVEEEVSETEDEAVTKEDAVAEVAQEASTSPSQEEEATPPTVEEVAGPLDALVESFRISIAEQIRTAEQRGYDRGYGVGYDKGHEDGYVDGKKVGEEEAGRRIRDAIQKALEAQDIED